MLLITKGKQRFTRVYVRVENDKTILFLSIIQYLRLLERFEILLSLEDGNYMIPCMMPREKPDIDEKMVSVIRSRNDEHNMVQEEHKCNYLTRNYHMEYIPAGFWPRLIGRSGFLFCATKHDLLGKRR